MCQAGPTTWLTRWSDNPNRPDDLVRPNQPDDLDEFDDLAKSGRPIDTNLLGVLDDKNRSDNPYGLSRFDDLVGPSRANDLDGPT